MTLAMCVAISCVSLLLQVFIRPYGTAEANRHEVILLAVQLMTLLIGGASRPERCVRADCSQNTGGVSQQ